MNTDYFIQRLNKTSSNTNCIDFGSIQYTVTICLLWGIILSAGSVYWAYYFIQNPSKYWFTQKLQLTACSGLFISESCLMTLRTFLQERQIMLNNTH